MWPKTEHVELKIYLYILKRKKFPSFICNLVSFNSTIKTIAKKIASVFRINENLILYNKSNYDKRNYKVGSKIFKKYFKNFKFSDFSKEVINMRRKMKFFKIKQNAKTVRMLYYKKLFT